MKTLLIVLTILLIGTIAQAQESRLEKQARELQEAGFDTKVVSKKNETKTLTPRIQQLALELQSAGFEVKSK